MTAPSDVLVVGGGPAGSVTATLLAQEGLRVRLLEGARFPRYHIGESITASAQHVLGLVGVTEALDSGPFQIKRGGALHWGDDHWITDWTALFGDQVHAWQVDRDRFDHLLLENAAAKGVEVREGTTAKTVEFDGDGRPTAVHCTADDGTSFTADGFDFLIDASGSTGLLSTRHFRNRRPHPFFRNVAIWGYWDDARILPETPEGGVNVISSPKGWYWVIPLHGGRASIGLVTHKDVFARDRREHASVEDLYQALIKESDTVSGLLADAAYRPGARVATDYSYVADRFGGPGYMMIGDSACFLDPLLSTGVHLALYGGLVGAASLLSMHRGEVTEPEGMAFFEFAYRRAYTRMLALVSGMYECYRGRDDFFWTADRLVGEERATVPGADNPGSFGEIISGLSDLREATEADTRVVTERLAAEAWRVQREALSSGPGRPAFDALRTTPGTDGELMGLRVVTEPRLGLERVPSGAGAPAGAGG